MTISWSSTIIYTAKRAPSKYILYVLQLYSSDLSLRKTSERLLPFIKRNHVSIWNWIQEYEPKKILYKRERRWKNLL